MNEIKQLEVQTAIYYEKQYQCNSVDEWIEKVTNFESETKVNKTAGEEYKLTRPRYWVAIPLGDFIGKMLDWRNEIKESNKPLSNMLKLIINTMYGVMVSPYFEISNTVVGNNITAKARCGVWMIAKALRLAQTITDGGLYSIDEVNFWKGWKPNPSLSTLADMENWIDKKNKHRWIGKLPGDESRSLDDRATEHVNNFWKPYGLELPFKLDHKLENSGEGAATLGKGHYVIKRHEEVALKYKKERYLFKVRGCENFDEESGLQRSVIFDVLKAIVDGKGSFKYREDYHQTGLLKVGRYLKVGSRKNPESWKGLEDLMPGDEYQQPRVCRFNNTFKPCDTRKEYKTITDRTNQRVKGKPMALFERLAVKGNGWINIAELHRCMLNNELPRGKGEVDLLKVLKKRLPDYSLPDGMKLTDIPIDSNGLDKIELFKLEKEGLIEFLKGKVYFTQKGLTGFGA